LLALDKLPNYNFDQKKRQNFIFFFSDLGKVSFVETEMGCQFGCSSRLFGTGIPTPPDAPTGGQED